jgi:uncharacterized membrane-anchored protein
MSGSVAGETNSSADSPALYVMRKLPHVTALFWVTKTVATTLGEAAGDFFSQTLRLGNLLSTVILLTVFLAVVVFQLRGRRFHAAVFWTAIALTSTAGTTLSDLLNKTAALGYAGGALILSTGLAIVLLIWWRSGQTLDVENIATSKGELLFWVAVLFSNSLGTSSGDFLADSLGLGLRPTALLLSAIMVALLVAHYLTSVSAMLLFWTAFILTRPLGTVLGNILSKKAERGGLNLGNAWASAILVAALAGLVAYQTIQVRRHPLQPLPAPINRHTGEPQRPNGQLVTLPQS